MSVVRQLYQLQLADSQWEAGAARLADIEANLVESDELVRARVAVDEMAKELGRQKVHLRALELEIGGLNEQLKKNEDALYEGKVRNPKELTDLQKQATSLRGRRSHLEDQQLELMIAMEEQEAELAERQARLTQIEETWHNEQSVMRAEKERVDLELAEVEELRQSLRSRLAASDLVLYDELRSTLGGVAVTPLKRGICQTCGVDVPTGTARAVERGEGFQFCPVCDRLLCAGC